MRFFMASSALCLLSSIRFLLVINSQFHLTKKELLHVLFTVSFLWIFRLDGSFLPALPPHSYMLQSLHPVANLTTSFSVFFYLSTVLILEGDLAGLLQWSMCKAEVCVL